MVPTRFFKDPDIMNLSSKDTQLILLGLILAADDEGREVAHAGLLGREMDYPAEQIEAALQDLVANDLLLLYQVGKHRYYHLTRWNQWQTLGGRITSSRYPAPPPSACPDGEHEQLSPSEDEGKVRGNSRENAGKQRGNSYYFPDQLNRTESKRSEDEGKANHIGEQQTSMGYARNVVPFPSPHISDGNGDGTSQKTRTTPGVDTHDLVRQIARILRLPVNDALTRLIDEYALVTTLSLPGEADAAREWIEDPKRNQKHKSMSPAFFRNWLKREMGALEQRQAALQQAAQAQATGTSGTASTPTPPPGHRSPNLMHLAKEDARIKGVKHT
ncbi:MAG: hypothetical protein ABI413_17000 [Ktedonobacteraceae bacterium]